MAQTGFYIDVYGRKRNSTSKQAIFEPHADPHHFMGCDALVITEVIHHWQYYVPTLPVGQSGVDSNGHKFLTRVIITSPNMLYIPDIEKGVMEIQARADGRYALGDFSIVAQWYFQGTYYLPYMPAKPEDLETHEFGIIWYDLSISDFIIEEGGLFSGVGRIRRDLLDKFVAVRKSLAAKIKVLQTDTRFSGVECAELLYAREAMLFSTIILECATQTYEMTLLTVTGFQRHFLEAQACYDYLTIYRDMDCSDIEDDREPIRANTSLMGTFTTSLEIAEKMYRQRVPVWLVRVPAEVPLSTTIVSSVHMRSLDICPKFLPNSQFVYRGHASAIQNRACQSLKVGNIRLGHGAYSVQPGDFNGQFIPEKELKNLYAPPLVSRSHSAPSTSTPAVPQAITFQPPSNKIQQRLSVNPEKFRLLLSPLCPRANAVWGTALNRVNCAWNRIWDHKMLLVMRGYPFPNPHIFANESNTSKRGKTYALGWLAMRPMWIARLTELREPHPRYPYSQNWKDLLNVDVAQALAFTDRTKDTVASTSKCQKLDVDVKASLGLNWRDIRTIVNVKWRDVSLCVAGSVKVEAIDIPERIYREIIWDLQEHNFRFELLALDRSLFPRDFLNDHDASIRDRMVVACFPKRRFVTVDWPSRDEGLGARKWEDQIEYVEAFRVLLSSWPGSVSMMLKAMIGIERCGSCFTGDERMVSKVEQVAYPFYCQTFFDYFGRAPTVPYQMPM